MSADADSLPPTVQFSGDELLRHAQGNATATALVTIAYLMEQDRPVEEWVAFVGGRLAPAWEGLEDRSPGNVARLAALNMASAGGEVLSLTGDEGRAEVILAAWPPPALLDTFSVTPAAADAFYGVFGPIAAALGLQYAWERGGDQVRLTFVR